MPDPSDDLALLQRIAARDDVAMAELYDRHHRMAYAIIRRIVQSPSDAEEVLELSARFGVPLGTVKTRIRSGLLSLRVRLEQTA